MQVIVAPHPRAEDDSGEKLKRQVNAELDRLIVHGNVRHAVSKILTVNHIF